MNRWIEFEISIVHKISRGSFGIKYERQGAFRFCAQSVPHAVAIAGYHVKGAKTSIDVTRMVQVVGAIPVEPDRSDECLYQTMTNVATHGVAVRIIQKFNSDWSIPFCGHALRLNPKGEH